MYCNQVRKVDKAPILLHGKEDLSGLLGKLESTASDPPRKGNIDSGGRCYFQATSREGTYLSKEAIKVTSKASTDLTLWETAVHQDVLMWMCGVVSSCTRYDILKTFIARVVGTGRRWLAIAFFRSRRRGVAAVG